MTPQDPEPRTQDPAGPQGLIEADHNATTACLPEAAAAMMRCLTEVWHAPSARGHAGHRAAQAEVDDARAAVADLIGARPDEIIFTSGATESCNLAILGVAERLLGSRPRMAAPLTEHSAVIEPLRRVAAAGGLVELLNVDDDGGIAAPAFACDQRTALVAAMLVNNETGVVLDVSSIAAAAHAAGALVLCDATQAPGRWPIDVAALGCDLLAISGHKFGAPKGIGALWLRRGLGLAAQIQGGGQERGLRSGTLNVPAIAALGVAARLARERLAANRRHLAALTADLEQRLRAGLPSVVIHGGDHLRVPGTTFITLPGLPRGWLHALRRTRAGGGASCSAGKPSRVLTAMGAAEAEAANALRLSLSPDTTAAAVAEIAEDVIGAATRLREAGPATGDATLPA
jgi:cysteine desulfurase